MSPLHLVTLSALLIVAGAAGLVLIPRALPDAFERIGPALRTVVGRLSSVVHRAYRYPELGGYVHDTQVSQWFGPMDANYVTGTWADAAGQVAGTVVKQKAAADNTGVVTVPINLLQNGAALKGTYLKSIDVYWETRTAALDALSAVVNKFTLPANGAAFAAAVAQAFTYDTGHDTAAERITVDQHTMRCTLSAPIWLDDDDLVQLVLTVDAAAGSVFDFIGARANFTLRL